MGSVAILSEGASSPPLFTRVITCNTLFSIRVITCNTLFSIDDNQRSKPSSYRNIRLDDLNEALDDLNEALGDLGKVLLEAHQENFPTPSQIAINNAEFLIDKSYKIFPSRFEVYPDQDGAIAVDIYNGKGKSVLLLCELTGEVLCLADLDGESHRKRYSQSETHKLPDSFIKKALEEL